MESLYLLESDSEHVNPFIATSWSRDAFSPARMIRAQQGICKFVIQRVTQIGKTNNKFNSCVVYACVCVCVCMRDITQWPPFMSDMIRYNIEQDMGSVYELLIPLMSDHIFGPRKHEIEWGREGLREGGMH